MKLDLSLSLGVASTAFQSLRTEDKCNGVKELCGFEPEEIFWYGAHNVGTEERLWLPHQTASVTELLKKHGVRVLLLDIYPSNKRDQNKGLGFTHIRHVSRVAGQKAHQAVLQELAQFLKDNPREVVILFYENHVQDWKLIQAEFEQAELDEKIYDPKDPEASHWTLGDMVKADKRVIVFFETKFRETEAESQARPELYRDAYWERGLVQDSYYGRKLYKRICQLNRGNPTAPFRQLNYWNNLLPLRKQAQQSNDQKIFEVYGNVCRNKEGGEAFYNLYITNHSHLGGGAAMVRSLNEALVNSNQSERGD